MPLRPDQAKVERFRRSLEALIGVDLQPERLGLAVSGGSDSMALLLLAAAASPGKIFAATVDHGFRAESADEARRVGELCAALAVPHDVLHLEWDAPSANRQALARDARYQALGKWAAANQLRFLATGHQLDDQAETLLMRLHRGAGLAGLAGVRARRPLTEGNDVQLVRPLLGWRRSELQGIVADCGIAPDQDPANSDPAHDRTRARLFLERSPDWPDRARMAASATYLAEAEEALTWTTGRLTAERVQEADGVVTVGVADLPPELKRRLVLYGIERLSSAEEPPRGDVLARAMEQVRQGGAATLAGVLIRPCGTSWRLERAPARRPVATDRPTRTVLD